MSIDNDPFREILDDPNISFERRSDILLKLDYLNSKFGIYNNFLNSFEVHFKEKLGSTKKFRVLEVGSGLAGLSRELFLWGKKSGVDFELNLFDSQRDILEYSREELLKKGISANINLATDQQLHVFDDNEFDFTISLHVIHHIRPLSIAAEAIDQMLRISKQGVLVNDFHRKPGSVALFKLWNQFFGISQDLSDDGVKSMQRAYDPIQLNELLKAASCSDKFETKFKTSLVNPYWEFIAKSSI